MGTPPLSAIVTEEKPTGVCLPVDGGRSIYAGEREA
jgi:hypothetical protein